MIKPTDAAATVGAQQTAEKMETVADIPKTAIVTAAAATGSAAAVSSGDDVKAVSGSTSADTASHGEGDGAAPLGSAEAAAAAEVLAAVAAADGQVKAEKPPYSYAALITAAITSQNDNRMTLAGIYDWITSRFPYFQIEAKGWKVLHPPSPLSHCVHAFFSQRWGKHLSSPQQEAAGPATELVAACPMIYRLLWCCCFLARTAKSKLFNIVSAALNPPIF